MQLFWEVLYNDGGPFPRLLEFGEFSDSRFRYGIDEEGRHCLFFQFSQRSHNVPIDPVVKANLSLIEKGINGRQTLILALSNQKLENLFNDLIGSVVSAVRKESGGSDKLSFIAVCNDWFDLFDSLTGELSMADLRGIFGELYFLKSLLNSTRHSPEDVVSAWKGPFGKGHDFELGDKHFEIKSISEGKSIVKISSEYQLGFLGGEKLFLVVYEFHRPEESHTTLASLIDDITKILKGASVGRISGFWTALAKAGISHGNLDKYGDIGFGIKAVFVFNCSKESFPAITRTSLPDAVKNVTYDLALGGLTPFLVEDLASQI
ncbi:MAG: hypothetical protein BGO21_26305 [Dyadobacter sp. 50-39]|uniref:PD-(D/E)XK motif protein n=1 Tax=Dyadobacter sp. 50-39 TaxID=1895756 RepID=UPI0009642501|nr:PD-(D/E)XK motif protein [Dyadobacter sp. 50-39]OJV16412.1 MAG: hypothetical protein BGO21_26305 [Dyadobacter sp. 50-39]